MEKYRQQFVLTNVPNKVTSMQEIAFGSYSLFVHSELYITVVEKNDRKLALLGSIYDYQTPENTNQQIAEVLLSYPDYRSILRKMEDYSGHFILIYRDSEEFIICGDATSSREIYYDADFQAFGSQPKLLCEFIDPITHTNKDLIDFYGSKLFTKERLFIGNTTHFQNIKHLLPNNYADINRKQICRYFPAVPLTPHKMSDVVPQICDMLRGFITAASLRKKLFLALTSGYDSRLLFMASLHTDSKYFVYKNKKMTSKHPDIVIPTLLSKQYGKSFEVIESLDEYEDMTGSVDFPLDIPKRVKFRPDHLYINGNISEIAKNQYAIRHRITPEILTSIRGYTGYRAPNLLYSYWLADAYKHCEFMGYNTADMFNWEDSKGIWFAKALTADFAIGIDSFTPYNSHKLLSLLLSVNAKYRNKHYHLLYRNILKNFSKDALKYPINPGFKSNIYKFMTIIGVFNAIKIIYLKYGVKTFLQKIKKKEE
ncbi:MAG: hypothetical protein FWG20_00265 [Candidatus Cloacimonetes bacterium]|nr:hypothetical protein [Candidatus Cloacimonadota bacterium]